MNLVLLDMIVHIILNFTHIINIFNVLFQILQMFHDYLVVHAFVGHVRVQGHVFEFFLVEFGLSF